MQTESGTPLSPNHPSTTLTHAHTTHTSKCGDTRQSVCVCVWWQKWAEKFSHSIKLLIWFCRRRESKSVFPVDWNGETYARTGSDCSTKSLRVYRVHTHTQFFSERRNTAHKIMSLKGFSWTATKTQTKGPAATNPHWPAELPWCSLMLSCPGPVLFSQRIHTRPVMNIQEFSPSFQDYPLFL